MEHTATDGKNYKTKFYSLDAVISVGYRVNSSQATQFRIWATNILKQHLIDGYTIHQKRIAERGTKELQQSIKLLQQTLTQNQLVNEIGAEAIQLIMGYAKTWHLLLAYDEGNLKLPEKTRSITHVLEYDFTKKAINTLKLALSKKQEASALFGNERGRGFESILNTIEQTFDGNPLYPTTEERAAHLLYFIIKDHPFTDGNKRIGCFIFLLYLSHNKSIKINDNGLIALALLVVESDPYQKDIIIRLIVNLLLD